jgi:N-acetyl-anhydromuramyl-L-alanine amidase AmpD
MTDPTDREKWEKEISLKERELSLKEKEHASSGWKNPLVVAIMAAAIAALGNTIVTMTNGKFQRELEDQKSEQSRILEMIKTGDPEKAAENLQFLLDSGLISQPDLVTRLSNFLKNRKPGSGPTLPSVASFDNKSLQERIDNLQINKKNRSRTNNTSDEYTVNNHILLDQTGNPVSIAETLDKKTGDQIKEVKVIVMHFSANSSKEGTVNVLAKNSDLDASAHVVIDRSGKVTQLVPFDVAAFHVGRSSWKNFSGLNHYSIGIMFINEGQLGQLQKVNNASWKSDNGKIYENADVYVQENAVSGLKSFWQQYTTEQIRSAEQVIKALSTAYPSIEAVVGHDEVALPHGRKNDPGPALPINRLNKSLIKGLS